MVDAAKSISVPATPFTALLGDQVLPFGGMLTAPGPGDGLGVRHLLASAGADAPGYCQAHQQAGWVLVATLAGQATVETAGWHAEVGPGEVYLIPPDLPFCERQRGEVPWTWMVTQVYTAEDAPCITELPSAPLAFRAPFAFLAQFAELLVRLNRQEPGDGLAAVGLLLALLGECQRQAAACAAGRLAEGVSPSVSAAMAYLRAHLCEAPALPAVAAHCGVSLSSLAHRFKAETGLTPLHWLTRERLRLARRLLLEGQSVSATAATLGFATPFHFSRVFTQSEGLPPSQFQRLARQRG
jgi:AraC family transcriptional regulator of arabinose operon